ncbi:NADH-quinone oxidoreductase subunit L [Actinoallomurus iriomotensis]|uniref:NADH-quinone oxidoreductase subunit L n=1 Tax=Actinoallomurus iriomotensis TaxID=478107 RepID=A0A9W6RQI0_9ACTN|nr:NADH-quinone oxidoreductase subunit L [Actinoallomurus iriomotensis]GLY79923.1 NADH-quinone oxidoreductase subunit L [Actinoallomurus iriomotensis]GLY88601.1 NADH-quinone oxidoreductase subunit L [Actinoallomurus iriomotensis]
MTNLLAEAGPQLHTQAATGMQSAAWLLIAFPLVGAAILLLGGRRTDKWGHLLGVAMSLASFVVGVLAFVQMLGQPGDGRTRLVHVYQWVSVGSFKADVNLLLDPLSISFVLLITGVGSLIHIYSIGYMSHDPDRRRFFAYLNLFVASMLLLVLADNYLGLYVGWEGVGLASYLLIGFWQHKPSAATAAKKAFIVNRVGDFGLSVAIMLMFVTFGSISFTDVFGHASEASHGTITAIGLLLLLGACGKSAQLPLQSWLLDAMEGPTPVSALIHAATMVTAGVYLVVRSHAIFELSSQARLLVTIVGAATLIAGALIGCAKDDIKKALAGSTMSQIGYMMLAAGIGKAGYVFAIAHLIAHGFFKAGLFLGAGSIMHGMNDDVDMRKYGGLRKVMPITFATFGLGYLAIIGFPFLSGWWTKDGIIDSAFEKGGTSGQILGWAALIGAGITAYYMSRVMFMTFFGEKRWEEDVHPHESPSVMTIPLILLAVGSVAGGAFLIAGDRFANFLAPVVGAPEAAHKLFTPYTIVVFVLMVVGVGIAYLQYLRRPVPRTAPAGSFPVVAARKDLYGDALNESLFMRPGQWLTRLTVYFDGRGVDGLVNGIAAFVGGTSGRVRRVQTGFVRSYALSMFFGAALIVGALLLVRI